MLKIQNQNDQVNINIQKTNSNAVILAAGQGIRMIPINNSVPKALLEVNEEILIERIIEQLFEANIHDITIVVGFMGDQFHYLIDKYGVKSVGNNKTKHKIKKMRKWKEIPKERNDRNILDGMKKYQ